MFIKDRSIVVDAPFVYYVTTNFLQSRYPTRGKTVCCSNVVLNKLDDNNYEIVSPNDNNRYYMTESSFNTFLEAVNYIIN